MVFRLLNQVKRIHAIYLQSPCVTQHRARREVLLRITLSSEEKDAATFMSPQHILYICMPTFQA